VPIADVIALGPRRGTSTTARPAIAPLAASTEPPTLSDELVFEELGTSIDHDHTGNIDFGVSTSITRRPLRIGLAIGAVLAAVAAIAIVRQTNDRVQSGRAALDQLRAAGPVSYTLQARGLQGQAATTGTFELKTARSTMSVAVDERTFEMRRDGDKVYIKVEAERWIAMKVQDIRSESLLGLMTFPTDVVALIGLVPDGGFSGHTAETVDNVALDRVTFSVVDPKPTAQVTDILESERLTSILEDLDGPLTGEAWFDPDGRLRKATVHLVSKAAGDDISFTVGLSDFGQEFTFVTPKVTEG
jgi:hypothetical protein